MFIVYSPLCLSGLTAGVDVVGRYVYGQALGKRAIPTCTTKESQRYLSDLVSCRRHGSPIGLVSQARPTLQEKLVYLSF